MQGMTVDAALLKTPQRLQLGGRLIAEPAHPSQADELLDLVVRNRAQLTRYLPGAAKLVTREQATLHFLHLEQQRHAGQLLEWALYFEGCLCGSLRLNYIDPAIGKAGVGYFLDADLQGRGLMTRALRGLLAHAFTQLGFNRIELRHAIDVRLIDRLILDLRWRPVALGQRDRLALRHGARCRARSGRDRSGTSRRRSSVGAGGGLGLLLGLVGLATGTDGEN
jgi:ribosomal-protein-serine acetyltransferase